MNFASVHYKVISLSSKKDEKEKKQHVVEECSGNTLKAF